MRTRLRRRLSAGTITEWGRDVDYRLAMSKVSGEDRKAMKTMADYVFSADSERLKRKVAATAIAPLTGESEVPAKHGNLARCGPSHRRCSLRVSNLDGMSRLSP